MISSLATVASQASGVNVAPAEIEDVLQRHPDVAEVAVAGVPDDTWGQIIAAFVVPRPGRRPDPDELRDWVRSRLRGAKTPDRIVFRDALPRTDTGKVQRRHLVADLAAQRPASR